MKSFKFQTPSTREITTLKLQIPSGGHRHGGFKNPRNCSSRRKEAHFEKKEWIRASLRRLLHILESVLGHRFGVWGFLILALSASCFASEPTPLVQAHAHNDYLHKRPLFEALENGFCSVEADIYLVDGKLLVAHERQMTRPERTLEALYLEPLRERVRKSGGRVYPHGPEFTLLIDLKSDWHVTYPVLRQVLEQYADVLTSFSENTKKTNAITAILTGNRSLKMFDGEKVRYAAYDGQLTELESNEPPDLIPWISSSWHTTFKWRGTGEMTADEKQKLGDIVSKAHRQGRRVRFYGSPDVPGFWREMLADGVDLINTDDLEGARRFLVKEGRAQPNPKSE